MRSAGLLNVLRVVADTNIYVSALHVGGVADELIARARARSVQLFISPAIADELERVLVRKFGWAPSRAQDAIDAIRVFAILVTPSERVTVIPREDPDNRILECALAAQAQIIVTGDRLLQALGTFRGIAIITPRQFLDALDQIQE